MVTAGMCRSGMVGGCVDARGNTILHRAVTLGAELTSLLMLSVASTDVNVANSDGETALHLAVRNPDVEVCRAVLSRTGVDANARNNLGQTPLHCAAEDGPVGAIGALCESSDVDVNAIEHEREFPLPGAPFAAADVWRGRTALHLAVDRASSASAIIRALARREELNVEATDANGDTALDYAMRVDCHTAVWPLRALAKSQRSYIEHYNSIHI